MGAWPRFSILISLGVALAAPAAAQFSDSYSFLQAVKSRDGAKATEILNKQGAPIDARENDTGDTGLHMVVRRHDAEWIDFLLYHHARTDIKDRFGNTPLHVAAQSGDIYAITQLIAYSADVNAENNNGETPLILAVHARSMPAVRLLVTNGGDARKRDTIAGKSAMDYANEDPRAAQLIPILATAKTKGPAKKISGPVLH